MTAETRPERYDPGAIEAKWQAQWDADGLYNTPDHSDKPNYYFVTMFPYPSGEIHVGHWYAFAPSDAAARFLRMRGHNVLFPMGFDAFGLPAENAAIKRKLHPAEWTEANMAHMRQQFRRMGASIDWRREVVTCYPEYYRWNQWMFLKFLERGLAYRAKAPVNWCPKDLTVLANEQVVNGLCDRCDTPVEKRDLEQWFYRITSYADELLKFEELDWPERVRLMQTNWIGRSEGARISFEVSGHPGERIEFFTTRPDTIFGATFMVLAPEHPLVSRITTTDQRQRVEEYVLRTKGTSDIQRMSADGEKTGVATGAFALNAFTGQGIPIWIADYVLAGYGTGAIMAVPAHDERDFSFAKSHGLEIREVISPDGDERAELDSANVNAGLMVQSGEWNGLTSEAGKKAISDEAKRRGIGEATVNYRLRDWLISRQRYWGTPIPIVYCDSCGIVPVPESQLPVVLPREVEFSGEGGNPLNHIESFVNTECPRCGGAARRETDTMDTFVDSSWYIYRYPDSKFPTAFMNREAARAWLPVRRYTGGIEHAILHLLYARFVCKVLRDLGELWFDEPFMHLRNQGTIVFGGRKMSKSRGNVQTPDEYVSKYGADTLRLFMMFMGPWTEGSDWDASGIEGVWRFLNKVWLVGNEPAFDEGERDDELDRLVQRIIKKVTLDIEAYRFNTAVAGLMELTNALQRVSGPSRRDATRTLLLLLAPLAPHITEELWQRRGESGSIHLERWPDYDDAAAAPLSITLVVQVDGKVRDRIEAPAGLSESESRELALASPRVQGAVAGRPLSRTVVIPDKLVSLVTDQTHE